VPTWLWPCDDGTVDEYIDVNLANWSSRVAHHEHGYGLEQFRTDPAHLSDVVRFDRPRLGSIEGLDVVHLQCHIGTDTLSLSRLGARSVTGVDFSAPALAVATQLAADCGAQIEYVESELYSAIDALGAGRFDLVYTGIGALCWLPDVHRWAQVVAALLRPGGRLFIREGHPMLWSLADPRGTRWATQWKRSRAESTDSVTPQTDWPLRTPCRPSDRSDTTHPERVDTRQQCCRHEVLRVSFRQRAAPSRRQHHQRQGTAGAESIMLSASSSRERHGSGQRSGQN
jgi:SAM-dependent methyltransferase